MSGTTFQDKTTFKLTKLAAHPGSFQFQRWFEVFLINSDKSYGHASVMWISPENCSATAQPFSPSHKPEAAESVEEFESRHEASILEATDCISALTATIPGQEAEISRIQGIIASSLSTSVLTETGPKNATGSSSSAGDTGNSEDSRQSLQQLLTQLEKTLVDTKTKIEEQRGEQTKRQQKFEFQLKLLGPKRANYNEALKRFESREKAHSQWVSSLKENIDVSHWSGTLKNCTYFAEMIDKLYACSNSTNSDDMHREWERYWTSTEKTWPINLDLWQQLRERYFTMHG
ncbi:hypothetical protein HK100_010850, partial [Physocladia obscura]